jgi:hypothetical protein
MATVAQNIATLEHYFNTGGELGPTSNLIDAPERAMRELIADGGGSILGSLDKGISATRAAFARAQIFEKTLSPPSLFPSVFVRPYLQITMFEGLYKIGTGGLWASADPAGLTPWIHTEGGSRYALETALTDPPRMYRGRSVELPPEVIATMLRVLRDVALPVSWFDGFGRSDVFARLEVRAASAAWSTATRRTILALTGQAKARILTELARIATAAAGAFPSFPTGDGTAVATAQPNPPPWYCRGWPWVGAALGAVGGGTLAMRRGRR